MNETELILELERRRAALEAELCAMAGREVAVAVTIFDSPGQNVRPLSIAAVRAGWKVWHGGSARWIEPGGNNTARNETIIFDCKSHAPRPEAS